MKENFSILNLTDSEQLKLSQLLKLYFPWLGTDDENVSGSDTIEELNNLYNALPQQD